MFRFYPYANFCMQCTNRANFCLHLHLFAFLADANSCSHFLIKGFLLYRFDSAIKIPYRGFSFHVQTKGERCLADDGPMRRREMTHA